MSHHLLSKLAFLQSSIITAVVVACLTAVPARADLGDELFKLTASDGATDDFFGYSVGISGRTAIVGAYRDGDAGHWSGSAYLFDVTTGRQIRKLTASDAAAVDRFGSSVAIDGNVAIVGAPGHNNVSGAAYVFDVTTGQELFKLSASDPAFFRIFGHSVAINGNTALVGAPGDDHAGSGSGSAYLFDVTTGQQLAKLTTRDASVNDLFGDSVAISGNTVLIGAPYEDQVSSKSGAAYLFDVTTRRELARLTTSDAGAFGDSVAISGNIALVGRSHSLQCCGFLGAAYLIDVTTGQELFKLTGSDPGFGNPDTFGDSVALSGNTAVVGQAALRLAYLFDVTSGRELTKLTASEADAHLSAVAISGNTAIVGAIGGVFADPNQLGAAYVFFTVPEPGSMTLLALGLPLLVWRNLRRSGRGGIRGRRRFVLTAVT
jgi:WD40 repeat protein